MSEITKEEENGAKVKEKAVETTQMFVQTTLTLVTSAFGLVVALAWNQAIKAFMDDWLGKGQNTFGLFVYALLATFIGVALVIFLAKLSARIGGEAVIKREANL